MYSIIIDMLSAKRLTIDNSQKSIIDLTIPCDVIDSLLFLQPQLLPLREFWLSQILRPIKGAMWSCRVHVIFILL